ncbi:ORF6N domain-containing protein [Candidatus Saccharibacteria bacterium]|nr:ORF6N domain-containing protein [Candidatus Saccharibacteria bacterium]
MSFNITDKIYMVRGQKVMLDADLAEIYGYTTKALNQQVKNNKEKFEGEEFMFQLTGEELERILKCNFCTSSLRSQIVTANIDGNDLRCQNGTANINGSLKSQIVTSSWGGNLRSNFLTTNISSMSRSLPYAFTEQGIYMLMTVLKGELAVRQSRNLVMAFKAMKDYIVENKMLLDRRENENAEKIKKIDAKVSKLANEMNEVVKRTEISPVFLDFNKTVEHKEFLLLDGEPIQAKEAYMEIYKHAKRKIYIIDNYINLKTLHLLQIAKKNLEIIFFTDNVKNYLRKSDLVDFNKERPDLKISFIKNGGRIHDRFIILDEKKVYSSGGSSKDAGLKMISIHEITEKFIKDSLLFEIEKLKRNGFLKLK